MWAHIKQKLHDQISVQNITFTPSFNYKYKITVKLLIILIYNKILDLLMELLAGELAGANLSAVFQMQAQ